jgi:hypothetical protein
MGMTVETSIASRALAELATGAVNDDARQDKDHAGDTRQVRQVLWAELAMAFVRTGKKVNDDVEDAGEHHHSEPELADRRDATKFVHDLYR